VARNIINKETKMRKREMIKEVRDVMTGNSTLSVIYVWKEGRSWKTEHSHTVCVGRNEMHFSRCCNEMTLKEAEQEFDEKELIGLYDKVFRLL
jgi:hypothetical protein